MKSQRASSMPRWELLQALWCVAKKYFFSISFISCQEIDAHFSPPGELEKILSFLMQLYATVKTSPRLCWRGTLYALTDLVAEWLQCRASKITLEANIEHMGRWGRGRGSGEREKESLKPLLFFFPKTDMGMCVNMSGIQQLILGLLVGPRFCKFSRLMSCLYQLQSLP